MLSKFDFPKDLGNICVFNSEVKNNTYFPHNEKYHLLMFDSLWFYLNRLYARH